MPRDASDRDQVRKLERAAQARARQDAQTLATLMSTIAGRQFMLAKLEACHIFSTSFSIDALQMAFNEGERNRGLDLLNDIMRHCPDQYVLMMRENNERHLATDRDLNRDAERTESDAEPEFDLYRDVDAAVKAGTISLATDDGETS